MRQEVEKLKCIPDGDIGTFPLPLFPLPDYHETNTHQISHVTSMVHCVTKSTKQHSCSAMDLSSKTLNPNKPFFFVSLSQVFITLRGSIQ